MKKLNWLLSAGSAFWVFIGSAAIAQTMSSAPEHHEPLIGHVLVDQLEYGFKEGQNDVAWKADAWYGGDYSRVWMKTEGDYAPSGGLEKAEVQLLYSRLLGYYWDLQAGLRHDFRPDPSRSYAVLGLQGLAPNYFEVDLQGFVSNKGDVSARLEAEYDLLITQRLVLQPRFETDVAVQEVRELDVGSGINDVELGLRLRYEITRKFAPYIGVAWERKLGETAGLARRAGEDVETFRLLTGLRLWF